MRMPCDKCKSVAEKATVHLCSECPSFRDKNSLLIGVNGFEHIWLCDECWKDEQYKRQEK